MASNHATSSRQDGSELFGSFHLGDTELVLPVTAVQEVVNFPAVVTPVPLAPAYLLGLFNLRGRLIPIVHLGQLLQLPDSGPREAGKIAIVEFRQGRIGLLFDATGEILRVRPEQKVSFNDDGGDALIGGALKLDGGQRILQMLSVDALQQLRDMPIPKLEENDLARQRAARGQRRQAVSFRVRETRLALPMSAIHEIIRVPELQRSVLGTELCLGMLNLRGKTVPVLDFAHFLGLPRTASATMAAVDFEDPRRIVVVRQQELDIGLLVDEVDSIVGYLDDELLGMPSFHADQPQLFSGCISLAERPEIFLLNPSTLLGDTIIAELAQGHRALYTHDAGTERSQAQRRRGARETYVTFMLDRLMGMRIDQLREVIEFPHELMQTPGLPDYVRGVMNLRRKLVTIIDLRAIYGMKEYADLPSAKVLIVENGEEKFGLVVDAIENIMTIDAGEKIGVPSILRQQIELPLRDDMREVVEMPGQRALLLLDAAPLTQRLAQGTLH